MTSAAGAMTSVVAPPTRRETGMENQAAGSQVGESRGNGRCFTWRASEESGDTREETAHTKLDMGVGKDRETWRWHSRDRRLRPKKAQQMPASPGRGAAWTEGSATLQDSAQASEGHRAFRNRPLRPGPGVAGLAPSSQDPEPEPGLTRPELSTWWNFTASRESFPGPAWVDHWAHVDSQVSKPDTVTNAASSFSASVRHTAEK